MVYKIIKNIYFQIPQFIKNAPYSLQCEVMTAMYGHHLSQSFIFYNLGDRFLAQLSTHLKRSIYFTGNYVVQQGDIDQTMYFINSGEVKYRIT